MLSELRDIAAVVRALVTPVYLSVVGVMQIVTFIDNRHIHRKIAG
jgi:hypothetical protein